MDALDYARDLVSFDSTSWLTNVPVTDYCEQALKRLGFEIERLEYNDVRGVRKANVIGKMGPGTGGMAYFGHTDVVPVNHWFSHEHGPFQPTVKEGRLYGRGSCDMKGSIACMLAAVSRLSSRQLRKPIYVTCTADEETDFGGASQVARESQFFKEMVAGDARGIIGESTRLGVYHAHKGYVGFAVISRGKMAHSSTLDYLNPNLAIIPYLMEMKAIHDELETDPKWQDVRFDPPTMRWNIGINNDFGTVNITVPHSVCTVSFRPMPGQDAAGLIDRSRIIAQRMGLEFQLRIQGSSLHTDPASPFHQELLQIVGQTSARTAPCATDGVMLQELRKIVILGPGDIAQAHASDEWIALDQLQRGTDLYCHLIDQWCCRI